MHVVGKTNTLLVERRAGDGSSVVLGKFDLTSLENGLVLEAWNILRVQVNTSRTNAESTTISVWFNPMFPETGFVGNASDAARMPKPLPPRIVATDNSPLGPGELLLSAGGRDTQIDYVSALPLTVI